MANASATGSAGVVASVCAESLATLATAYGKDNVLGSGMAPFVPKYCVVGSAPAPIRDAVERKLIQGGTYEGVAAWILKQEEFCGWTASKSSLRRHMKQHCMRRDGVLACLLPDGSLLVISSRTGKPALSPIPGQVRTRLVAETSRLYSRRDRPVWPSTRQIVPQLRHGFDLTWIHHTLQSANAESEALCPTVCAFRGN